MTTPFLPFASLLLLLPVFIQTQYNSQSPWPKLIVKSLCSLLFLSTAVISVKVTPGLNGWFVFFVLAAFLMSVAGDVLLAWPMEQSLKLGLAAFLAAQLLYAAAFIARYGLSPWDLAIFGILAAAALLLMLGLPKLMEGNLRVPVVIYALALSAMAAKAVSGIYIAGGLAAWFGAAGGLLFYASDVILAFDKFSGGPPRVLQGFNLAVYYLGQGLLALSLYFTA
jgi:uncharacterized membrane protein YhhN